jgi:hypothetical protein
MRWQLTREVTVSVAQFGVGDERPCPRKEVGAAGNVFARAPLLVQVAAGEEYAPGLTPKVKFPLLP